MAHVVDHDFGSHVDITAKLETLLNSASGTITSCGILKISSDRYLCWVAYEAT